MQYTRLYADVQGASHFEDVEADLMPNDYAPPAPSLDLCFHAAQFRFMKTPA